ncbi:MAG TPA: PQQ-binding-like beta-propeller repeat protein [Chloroflexia bacterium]
MFSILLVLGGLGYGFYYLTGLFFDAPSTGSTAQAPARDEWPAYMQNGARTGFNAGETRLSPANASKLKLLWKVQLGNVLAAQPIVKNGIVYVGSWNGSLYAFDTKNGSQLWKKDLGRTTSKRCVPDTAGISSAPAVTDDALYIGGGGAYFFALNPKTGAELWKFQTGDNSEAGGAYNWASPIVHGGRVYTGIASFCDRPFAHGKLWGLNTSTGAVEQQVSFVPEDQRGGGIWTSPTVDEASGHFYVTTGSGDYYIQHSYSLARLNPNTLAVEDAWQIPIETQVFDGDWGTTPTLFRRRDGGLMAGAMAKNGYYYAFDTANMRRGPAWSMKIGDGGSCPQCGDSMISSSAYAYDTLFAASGYISLGQAQKFAGMVYALDPSTGGVRWSHPTQGSVFAALAVANGLIVAAPDDTVEVLDAATGKVLWEYATGGVIYAAPTIAGGTLYVASTDGYLYAFSAGPYDDKAQAYNVASVGSNPPGFTPFRTPVPAPRLQGEEQCFQDTGHCVRGGFLDFWRDSGGLDRLGPAVTDELSEAGRTVQYFRNAVLEIGPDLDGSGPHVRLGRLDFRLFYYTPTNEAFDPAAPSPDANSTYVPETHHNLAEPFLSYWRAHGDVPDLGYPVSEPLDEYSVLDDKMHRVQYFERARLEIAAGPDGTEQVVMGALGLQRYKQRYGTFP